MRFLFSFFLLLCALEVGFAQLTDKIIDSLEQELESKSLEDIQKADALNELGYRYWIVNSGTSVTYGQEALELSQRLNYEAGVAKAQRVLGVAYWTLGEAKLALENLSASQRAYRKLDNNEGYANALMNTGMVYADLGDYRRALKIYDESIQKFTVLGLNRRIATTFTKIGEVYLMQGKLEEAKSYLTNALQMHTEDAYTYGMGEAHNKLAIVFLDMGELEQADHHLRKAVELGKQVQDEDGFIGNLIQYGRLQRLRTNYTVAEGHLMEALTKAREKQLKKYELAAYKELKLLKKEEENYKASLAFYDAYISLKDSIYNADRSKQIAAMEFGQELEAKEKEIALLQERERNGRIVNWSLGIGALGLSLIGFLLFNNQRQKSMRERESLKRKQELLLSKEQLAKTELENARLKQRELQQQIDFKNKELTSYTLNFVQKNELLHQLEEKITEIKNSSPAGLQKLLNDLDRNIKQHVNIDRDWEDFRRFFAEVHTDFQLKLKKVHPDLSSNDLKICALTRLNLNVKETASILGISPESAKTARYRLRKKLGLAPEQELLDYFLQMEKRKV